MWSQFLKDGGNSLSRLCQHLRRFPAARNQTRLMSALLKSLRKYLPSQFFDAVPETAAAELVAKLASETPPQIVDVRTTFEFSAGHIAGAINIPITSFPWTFEGLNLDKEREVVVICLSAHRSIPAARMLLEKGYKASQLMGGMQAWRAAKLAEVDGDGKAVVG